MNMKLTPRDQHVLNVLKRQGFVAIGTEHCGTGTAGKLEQLGLVDCHSFVDKSGSIRFCVIPKDSDPAKAAYVREHANTDKGAIPIAELMPRVTSHTPALYKPVEADVRDMIRSAMKIMQFALDKLDESQTV